VLRRSARNKPIVRCIEQSEDESNTEEVESEVENEGNKEQTLAIKLNKTTISNQGEVFCSGWHFTVYTWRRRGETGVGGVAKSVGR
jgi:hypothetical protein